MTRIEINGSDTTTLRLLHLDLPPEAIERFTTMAGTGEWPLKYGLGATKLRQAFVDVVDIRDLGPMTLTQYLSEAYDVSPKVLGPDQAMIDGLSGHVVVLPPQAFDATSQTLSVAQPLRVVGSYDTAAARGPGAALRSPSAEGQAVGGGASGSMPGMQRLLKLVLIGVAVLLMLVVTLVL